MENIKFKRRTLQKTYINGETIMFLDTKNSFINISFLPPDVQDFI